MKRYSEQDLFAFVGRADTHEKVSTAEAWLNKYAQATDMSIELYDELMRALSDMSLWLYDEERRERTERYYSAACPWNAPGMSARDFI